MGLFEREERKSIVQQLRGELGTDVPPAYMDYLFGDGALDDGTRVHKKSFAEILEPFVEDKIEDDYAECKDCGCLVAKDKVLTVKRNLVDGVAEEYSYCKHCKPPYDEITVEWNDEDEEYTVIGYTKSNVKCDEKGKLLNKLNK